MTSVVIVEPDTVLAQLLWAFLASHGLHASVAPDLREAQRRCAEEGAHAVVVDLDGLQAAADGVTLEDDLRALPPAVLLAGPKARLQGAPAPRAPVLSKPFDPDELLLLVKDAAERAGTGRP